MTFAAFRPAAFATAGFLMAGISVGHAEPYLYVPTTGDPGRIEIIDVATHKRVKTIGPFEAAHGLAGAPNAKHLVVGSFAERDASTPVAKPKSVSANDHAAHHGNSTQDSAAQAPGISVLSVFDRASGEVVRRIDMPGGVHHVALSPNARFVAATHPANGSVSIVDLQSFELIAIIPTGEDPNYAAFAPDGATLYVSVAGENSIAIVGAVDWRVQAKVVVGDSPEHLRLTRNGVMLFVNNVDSGSVSAINLAQRKVVRVYELGGQLHGIDLTDDEQALIVSLRGSDQMARISLGNGMVMTTKLEPSPYHVTTVSGTGKVFVSSAEQNSITVLNQHDLSVIATIKIDGTGHQMQPVFATAQEIGVPK